MIKILGYILALILIAITLFNLYATSTSKTRKTYSPGQYQQIMAPIETALLKEMKKRSLNFSKVKRLMTYKDEGIILGYDTKNKMFAVAMGNHIIIDPSSELKDVRKVYETSGKNVLGAKVILAIKDEEYTYAIATKKFNPKGIIGKVVYDTTEDFYNFMEEVRTNNNG